MIFLSKRKRKKKTIEDYIRICVITLAIMTILSTAASMAKYKIERDTSSSAGKLKAAVVIPKTQDFVFETNLVQGKANLNESLIQGDRVTAITNNRLEFQVTNYYDGAGQSRVINEKNITYTVSIVGDGNVAVTNLDGSVIAGTQTLTGGAASEQKYLITSLATSPGTYTGTIVISASSPYQKEFRQEVSVLLEDAKVTSKTEAGAEYRMIDNGAFARTFTISSDGVIAEVTGVSSYSIAGGTTVIHLAPYEKATVKIISASNIQVSSN